MDGFLGSMPIASLLVSTRSLFLRATFARNITTMEQVRILMFLSFSRLELRFENYRLLTCSHLLEEIIYSKLRVKCKSYGKKRNLLKLMPLKIWMRLSK